MRILFEKNFGRDLKKVKDKRLLRQVRNVIEQVESVTSLNEVENLKKLQGFDVYYRIRWETTASAWKFQRDK
jgi:mRNA interferase RelE/StbE